MLAAHKSEQGSVIVIVIKQIYTAPHKSGAQYLEGWS